MRVVPERSPWLQIASVFGGFFLGPFSALRLANSFVPDSDLVQTAGVFAFVLVFVGGTLLWMGLGFATLVLQVIRGNPRGAGSPGASDRVVPPGYRSYVLLGILAGVSVGLLAGLVTHLSVASATGLWGLLGAAYGVALWAAAHHGYLPFSEPD